MSYSIQITTSKTQNEAVSAVRSALQEQGFGVLTEIDMAATLKNKLDVDLEPYLILGACRPPLAHAALQADRSVGVLLPCNVVVRQGNEGTIVEAMDPGMMVEVSGSDAFAEVAADARTRLEASLAAVG